MGWTNQPTARLSVRKSGTTDTLSFEGVNADNNAGTPSEYLAAANRILTIAGLSAVIDGITKSIKQEDDGQ
ncbi:MAG: hypothetical protein IJP68_09895 [Selenomonadaceae bacterium]|nr:hypothetical protein [Selenomonadaceae bacterium]